MASLLTALFCLWVPASLVTSQNITIGGLFHSTDDLQELAFQYAVESVYEDHILPYPLHLIAATQRVPEYDNFQVSRVVCGLFSTGVAAIFGPESMDTWEHVQSMCDATDIPHVGTTLNVNHRREDFLVNLYPHPATLSKVYMELVRAFEWTSFTVLYEDGPGLVRLHEVLKMNEPRGFPITVRQLDSSTQNYRPVLRQIKASGMNNIVLDCSIDKLFEVLKQAQQVGLMTSRYNFIITTMDMHTIDLEPFQHGGTNITGVRLINPEDEDVQRAVSYWIDMEMKKRQILDLSPQTLRVSAALMYDGVQLFAKALSRLDELNVEVSSLDCDSNRNWIHGATMLNFMKDGQSTLKGLTGMIHFDNEGFRSNFILDVVELSLSGLEKVGTWNSSEGLNLTRQAVASTSITSEESVQNRTFLVLTALSQPYGMHKNTSETLKGNERFEGFGIDLIHEISVMLGFNYTFELQEDNAYGSYNRITKNWNGMIRQLMDDKADLAITDLTITAERENATDFTMPFMNLGISILYKKPTKQAPELFSFMSPFSIDVWMCMLAAYVGVSVLLFIMGRFCPYEWTNPYPCIEEPDTLENQFSLKNSLWFTIGSLMQQGSEIAPIAVSTRMVAGIWWFFTLIMVSSYTANLAAFLTVENTVAAFKTAEELHAQSIIKYGAKRGGSTLNFFRDSSSEVYQDMFRYMNENPEVLTKTNEEGLERVKKENYAFIMESTSIEYIVERNCEVAQVGGLLDAKGYGIAMKKNSPYRNALSTAVLKLQESGKLTLFKNKWWKEERGGGACQDEASSGNPSPLGLANVGGVFVVLVVGLVVSVFLTVFELLWNVCETSAREKVPFREELIEELRFIAKCHGSTKPVRKYTPSEFVPLGPYTGYDEGSKHPLT